MTKCGTGKGFRIHDLGAHVRTKFDGFAEIRNLSVISFNAHGLIAAGAMTMSLNAANDC
jgi:hypothetical protein